MGETPGSARFQRAACKNTMRRDGDPPKGCARLTCAAAKGGNAGGGLNLVRLTPKLSNSSHKTKGILVIPLANDRTNIPNRSLRRGKPLAGHIHHK